MPCSFTLSFFSSLKQKTLFVHKFIRRTSSPEAARYYHQEQDEEDEGVDFEFNDEPHQQQQPIIVSEVQESGSSNFHRDDSFSRSASSAAHHSNDEPLEARESRNNIFGIGISNDNDDGENNVEDELSTSYNNILLSPRGAVSYAPYPLIGQQRQHLKNLLFAPIQSESISLCFRLLWQFVKLIIALNTSQFPLQTPT